MVLGREHEVVAEVVGGEHEVRHLLPDLRVRHVCVAAAPILLEVAVPVGRDSRMGDDPGLERAHRRALRGAAVRVNERYSGQRSKKSNL